MSLVRRVGSILDVSGCEKINLLILGRSGFVRIASSMLVQNREKFYELERHRNIDIFNPEDQLFNKHFASNRRVEITPTKEAD
jgi:hypothetical protein